VTILTNDRDTRRYAGTVHPLLTPTSFTTTSAIPVTTHLSYNLIASWYDTTWNLRWCAGYDMPEMTATWGWRCDWFKVLAQLHLIQEFDLYAFGRCLMWLLAGTIRLEIYDGAGYDMPEMTATWGWRDGSIQAACSTSFDTRVWLIRVWYVLDMVVSWYGMPWNQWLVVTTGLGYCNLVVTTGLGYCNLVVTTGLGYCNLVVTCDWFKVFAQLISIRSLAYTHLVGVWCSC